MGFVDYSIADKMPKPTEFFGDIFQLSEVIAYHIGDLFITFT